MLTECCISTLKLRCQLSAEAEPALFRGYVQTPFDRKIYYLYMIKIIFYVVIVGVEPPSTKFSLNMESP